MSSIVATYDAGIQAVRLVVDLSDQPGPPASVTVWRDSSTTVAVRNAEPLLLVTGRQSVADYEAPRDVPATWRITIGALNVLSNTVTPPSGGKLRLVHPGKPSLSVDLGISSQATEDPDLQTSIYEPLDREDAISSSQGFGTETSSLTAVTLSNEDRIALKTILKDGSPLFLAAPPLWIDQGYVQFTDAKLARVQAAKGEEQARAWTLEFARVGRPSGLGAAEYTYGDVANTYATYSALLAGETNYFDVLDGPG